MPLKHLLKNKLILQKNFNTQEDAMDNWPYWMFEENIKIANEIIEEENESRKRDEEGQQSSMPNMDPSSMMRNMTSNIPKF